jgi:hypothetical protein
MTGTVLDGSDGHTHRGRLLLRACPLRRNVEADGEHGFPLPVVPPGSFRSDGALAHFKRDGFHFETGVPTSFESSSGGVRRTFCSACGTPLTYETEKWPSETDVTTCSVDALEAFPPTHHSWTSHDVAWMRTIDELPAFPQSRPAG